MAPGSVGDEAVTGLLYNTLEMSLGLDLVCSLMVSGNGKATWMGEDKWWNVGDHPLNDPLLIRSFMTTAWPHRVNHRDNSSLSLCRWPRISLNMLRLSFLRASSEGEVHIGLDVVKLQTRILQGMAQTTLKEDARGHRDAPWIWILSKSALHAFLLTLRE